VKHSFPLFRRLLAGGLFTVALAGPFVLAQQQSAPAVAEESPTITAETSLVLVPVTVTDRKGKLVDGLTAREFVLTDDGRPQRVRIDTSDTIVAPVSMVVLVQASGISAPAIARIKEVAPMIKPVVAGQRGQVAVLGFDDEVRVFQDFTTDANAIEQAIQRVNPRIIKKSALLDAVGEAVRMLSKRPVSDRRLIFILSEARDRSSKLTLREARELAERGGAVIYSATYSVQAQNWTSKSGDAPPMPMPDPSLRGYPPPSNPNYPAVAYPNDAMTTLAGGTNYFDAFTEVGRLGQRNVATQLAQVTGGRHLAFVTVESLQKLIERMGAEIHSQYLLSFVPSESKNRGFHELEITIPSRKDLIIRVRQGYWPGNQLPDFGQQKSEQH
jgi:VWFA-related protein